VCTEAAAVVVKIVVLVTVKFKKNKKISMLAGTESTYEQKRLRGGAG